MFVPGRYSEAEVLVGYLEQQIAAIRASAFGLTDEQARATPCRSALSIGGLLKHTTYVLTGRERSRATTEVSFGEADVALFVESFALRDDESLEGALDALDAAATAFLDEIRVVDPGAAMIAPPAPWDGLLTPTESVERFQLVHLVEELARHAGHADIVREQLDGADASSLLMAVEGRPGNDFVQPWTPPLT